MPKQTKQYNPREAETRIRKFWEKEKIYKFDPKTKRKIFSIDTPPPTVSGKMHIGHAFSYSQQDFIARFQRMSGKSVFYPFGTDDNGLATERLIEKIKNVKATKMKRDEFVKLCLTTLDKELRPKYIEDWKRIGMSCDWDIFYTTIDKHSQKISQAGFIDLYKKNRTYRKRTPFMWCPECQTSIAQVELNDKTKKSNLVYLKFNTTIGKPITIATTRPELMPACVAIHVNPDDKRYKDFIGRKANLPIFNRQIKIYANKDVDPEFGSGAVYHCTFGDMEDAEWIEKMKIKPIEIMNKDGTLNKLAGKYQGMKSEQARKEIIKDLKKLGLIEKIEPIEHVVNIHERCGTDIEILMTHQWFIRYLDLKKDMLKWGNELNWHPPHMKNRYDNWVKGLKWDWNISRQRFFGVPFPVWYCKKCSEIILADEKQLPVDPLKNKPAKKCKCGSSEFIPEKDVLDTWATSSLTPRLAIELMPKSIWDRLFPMSLRPQAHDIITFWLFNTTVRSNLHYNKNPWENTMISGWALDPHGKKMSKSKGNVVEPQKMIEKYSADSLRFWAAGSKLGEDLPFQEKDFVTAKKFTTKLWNASRFTFMHLKDYNLEKPKKLETLDSWILDKLTKLVENSTKAFTNYEYSKVKLETEHFFWHIFCDNYLEIIKDRLYNPEQRGKEAHLSAQYTLYITLNTILKLIAPIMPFITEELYQQKFAKNEKTKSIHISSWPKLKKKEKNAAEIGDLFIELLTKIRQEKTKAEKSMKTEITLTLETEKSKILKPALSDLEAVASIKKVKDGKFKVEFA